MKAEDEALIARAEGELADVGCSYPYDRLASELLVALRAANERAEKAERIARHERERRDATTAEAFRNCYAMQCERDAAVAALAEATMADGTPFESPAYSRGSDRATDAVSGILLDVLTGAEHGPPYHFGSDALTKTATAIARLREACEPFAEAETATRDFPDSTPIASISVGDKHYSITVGDLRRLARAYRGEE